MAEMNKDEVSNIEIEPLTDEDLDSVAGGNADSSFCCCTTNGGTCTSASPSDQIDSL